MESNSHSSLQPFEKAIGAPLIFLVEDESRIADLLIKYLILEGYAHKHFDSGQGLLTAIKKDQPQVILLDLMLPGTDGLTLCKEIRAFSDVPIIMTTARVEEIDRLMGFDVGADDYLCKPFSPKELMARIKVHLRRTAVNVAPESTVLCVADLTMDVEHHQVRVGGEGLKLTQNEFNVLKTLMTRPDRVFSRQELLNAAQGLDYEGYERNIDTHIKNLRRKIAQVVSGRIYIESVYGVGYRLLGEPKEEL